MNKSGNNIFLSLKKKLFILLGVFIPTSIAITNIIIGLLLICWILEGELKQKIKYLRSSKWILSIFGLIGLYVLGMFWGEIHSDAMWQFQRLALLLVFPLLATLKIDQGTIKNSVLGFLFTTFISALVAILINYNIICPLAEYFSFISNLPHISAFIGYNYHNILLSFSSTICLYLIIENKTKYRYLLILLFIAYAISIFTESGRGGQLIFSLSVISYIVYYSIKYSYKFLLFLLLFLFFQIAIYEKSEVYKKRVDYTLATITTGFTSNEKDINYRFLCFKESVKRILKKPILGYGTGSFRAIFQKEVKSQYDFSTHRTPHNQYLYVLFELGIFGLILLLMIFNFQIRELFNKKDGFHRVLLPVSFMIIMLVDSYLFIFTLTIAYIYLYTIYANYESE